MNQAESYHSNESMVGEKYVCKMQRILNKLRSEIMDKQKLSGESVHALTRESQLRLMNYKELHLHRESIGEDELNTVYEKMSVTEREIADEGVSALGFIIERLDDK